MSKDDIINARPSSIGRLDAALCKDEIAEQIVETYLARRCDAFVCPYCEKVQAVVEGMPFCCDEMRDAFNGIVSARRELHQQCVVERAPCSGIGQAASFFD